MKSGVAIDECEGCIVENPGSDPTSSRIARAERYKLLALLGASHIVLVDGALAALARVRCVWAVTRRLLNEGQAEVYVVGILGEVAGPSVPAFPGFAKGNVTARKEVNAVLDEMGREPQRASIARDRIESGRCHAGLSNIYYDEFNSRNV